MILYVKKPFTGINMKNVILLDDEESGGLIYVGKETYDQALKICTRFDGDYGSAWKHCAAGNITKEDKVWDCAVKWKKTVPEPINYLAFAFQYIKDAPGIDWASITREDMFGYMHELSMMLDFNACTLVPPEVRAKVSVPTALLKSYKRSWDEYTVSLQDLVVVDNRPEDSVKISDMTVGQLKELLSGLSIPAVVASTSTVVEKASKTEPVKQDKVKQPAKKIEVEEIEEIDEEEDEEGEDDIQAMLDEIDRKTADSMGLTLEQYRRKLKGLPIEEPTQTPQAKVVQTPAPKAPHKPIAKPIEKPTGTDVTINGNPVAQYDPTKAQDTIDALNNFADA